jgi:hypothetical protein
MSDLSTQIAVLETEMKNIAKQVDEGFSTNTKEHKEIMSKFQLAINLKADKKDVDTLVENQRWIVKLILSIVIMAVIGLVIKTNL